MPLTPKNPSPRRAANRTGTVVLHDRFTIKGGGERLALTLAGSLADALCFGYHGADGFDPAELLPHLAIYDLQASGGPFGWRTIKFLRAFRDRTRFISDYEVALYSGILAPVAIRNHPKGRNIFYCHTPPRFAYDQYDFHMRQLAAWKRPFMALYVPYLKSIYEAAVAQMDCIVVNSVHVQQRVTNYLGKPSIVVHPPCDTERFLWTEQGDYYLSTARLEPLKRVGTIVQAFLGMPDKKLVVLSGGSELRRLRALAGGAPNIHFTGWVDEKTLLELVGGCIATLYMPVEEDFGMSPVESMSAGKPVIGVAEGGMTETVLHGATGILLPPAPQADQVAAAVRELTPQRALEMRETCRERAALFSEEIFVERMRRVIHGKCPSSEEKTSPS